MECNKFLFYEYIRQVSFVVFKSYTTISKKFLVRLIGDYKDLVYESKITKNAYKHPFYTQALRAASLRLLRSYTNHCTSKAPTPISMQTSAKLNIANSNQ